MIHKKSILSCAAVLLALAILLPSVRSVDAVEEAKAKLAPALSAQLTAAKPGEYVQAVVRMATFPKLQAIRGDRAKVFNELRSVAAQSQQALVDHLATPDMRTKAKVLNRFWIDNLVLVEATPEVIRAIAERPDVAEVFDNFKLTIPPKQASNEQYQPQQTQTQLWDSIKKIGAKQVWTTYGFTGAGIVVGGLDTGVDITHPDIAGKMRTNNPADPTYPGGWAEFDANGNIVSGSVPHDSDQHGTHTTGTAIGGNASGYAIGVAPGATLMHGLVIPGGSGTYTQVAAGMQWIIDPDGNPATDDGADVVNMSLGGPTSAQMITPTDNMCAANVFPSFAIGNSGPGSGTTGSPGNVPSAYAVGAVDSNDVIASFSSRGPITWNNPPYVGTYTKPDISAPGVLIYSSIPGGTWQWHGDGFDWSGTSMATPHVTGTVALMRQANPILTVDQIKQLLAQTAIDEGTAGMDNDYGWGRVNAFAAVSAALTGIGTLSGTVTSSAGGAPVENAKILMTDTGQKVYTDASGEYSIQLVAGSHSVQVSRFGYDIATATVDVTANATTVQNFVLNQLPSGTIAGTVTDFDTHAGIAANITIKFGGDPVLYTSTNPSTGEYSVVLPVGSYDLVFSPAFPYPLTTRNGIAVAEGATTTLNLELNAAQVLIVDDDAGGNFQTYFEQAVAGAGRSYITVATPPTAATMALFESVIWLTGNDYTTTLSTADEAELASYLDGGGRLFITGQDIGYDIHTDAFYADYLHAVYVQDDVSLGGVIGVSTNPVGYGFMFDIKGGTGADNQAYPSEINTISPATAAFVYNPLVPAAAATANDVVKNQVSTNGITQSGTAGLTFDNGIYKLVYFAFGFEAIADATTRTDVMDRVLDWLQGYPKIAHTPLGDTEDFQHPYRVVAYVTSEYYALDPATVAVIYNAGAGDQTIHMTATGVPDEYEAYIPAQAAGTEVQYYITASDVEGHTTTDPVGAPINRHIFHVAWDTQPPTVEHERHYDTNDLEGPYHIYATATDNLGIESMYLMWARNGGMFHRQRMELMPDGRYHGAIPGPSQVGDVIDYYLYAMDEAYNGNVTRVPATGTYSFEIVEYFMWDFESDDGGFQVAGDVWEWGAPTSGPGGAHSGSNLWATVLGGNYPNSANAKLDIPPITLAASKPYALLSFWHWYATESSYDGGNVKVSTDGGATWNLVEPLAGYTGTASTLNAGIPGERCFIGTTTGNFWHQEMFDLSAYSGSQVMIRFHFGSDGSVNYAGWYVDDVMLRSTDVDDIPPIISGTTVPRSSFDTAGPYTVTTNVMDVLSSVAGVSIMYSTDGGATFTEVAMTPTGVGNGYTGTIPGQPNGTRIKFYVKATDTSSLHNVTVDPAGAPATCYEFSILPSASILVVLSGSTSGTSLAMFKDALDANGNAADYWDWTAQGWLTLAQLQLYKTLVIDEPSGLTTQQMTDLTAYLGSGTQAAKKRLFLLGRDLGYSSTTRLWIEQYMRAAYVQDNPNYWQISGYPGDPIGAGETFIISGLYPDEVQRSTTYPGGEIVYQYTGTGTSRTWDELRGEYEKEGKEWDGVVPNAPISLDAAAAMKYSGATYRSVYFAFNLYYIQESVRRAGIADRVLDWLGAPDIAHTPLHDTEDTSNPYPVVAQIYSETLDLSRILLTYDVGAGAVVVHMVPTANPNEYSASIPAQPNGTTVNYYISAANTDGTTSYSPTGAPAVQHTFQVTTDITPPVIVHVPLSNTADATGPYLVKATITDNIGVDPSGVTLTYNKNGGVNTTIPMAAMGGDLYQASIPGPSVLGDVYNYYIRAKDVAAVPNFARDPASGYHSFTIVDYYSWDFELDNGGFTATGPDWEWGQPTYASGPASAHSGVNLWGTKLATTYSYSSNSKLDLPAVKVPSSHTYAFLSFWQWYAMETNWDGGNVKISTDGGATWTILTPDIAYNGTANSANAGIPGEPCWTGTTTGNFWQKVTFNLTAYKGQTVNIRMHFGSDGSVNYAGWYVDDVLVQGGEDTASPSFISTTVPASTWDNVGPYVVTTKVSDPLSGVASVTLFYSTNSGTSWNSVAMAPTGTQYEYSGNIPGQPPRTKIWVYVSATDNASNTGTDPATAPAAYYQFGIMPSGDYLVLLGGTTAPAQMYIDAFTAIGKTCDVMTLADASLPTLAQLNAYVGIIAEHGTYFSTAQQTLLTNFLDQNDGVMQQIFFLGKDLSYYSSARTFMEKYTGAAYVQDDPGSAYRYLWGVSTDPIGGGLKFAISGSYPDELKRSTIYPGGEVVFRYHQSSTLSEDNWSEEDVRALYYKAGKTFDGVWPMTPTAPDSAAAMRYVGTHHASVYFAFNFNYITDAVARATALGRVLDWLTTATSTVRENVARGNETPEIPDRLTLMQNYPNPFNPVTTIQFGVPADVRGRAELRIYNVKGELVKTLFEGIVEPGLHTYRWDGTNLNGRKVTSGIYFYRFVCGDARMTKKMVLLR
jgi:subtilisin family serine protease